MQKRNQFVYLLVAGWLSTAIAVGLLAFLLIPAINRSPYFPFQLAWTEVLIVVWWVGVGLYIAPASEKREASRFDGVAPTISMAITFYCLVSFFALLVHAMNTPTDASNRFHWVIQILALTIISLCVIFLLISRASAATRSFGEARILSPRELHDMLAMSEATLGQDRDGAFESLKANVKGLREALLYSLNEPSILGQSFQYQVLCDQVSELCDTMTESFIQYTHGDDNSILVLCDTAKRLSAEIRIISSKQVRR